MPKFVRGNQPPPPRLTLHVRPVRPNFEIREEAPAPLSRRQLREEAPPAPPKFTRRALVPAKVGKAEALECQDLRPITKSQLMSRRG
jgi:hypothetical protein